MFNNDNRECFKDFLFHKIKMATSTNLNAFIIGKFHKPKLYLISEYLKSIEGHKRQPCFEKQLKTTSTFSLDLSEEYEVAKEFNSSILMTCESYDLVSANVMHFFVNGLAEYIPQYLCLERRIGQIALVKPLRYIFETEINSFYQIFNNELDFSDVSNFLQKDCKLNATQTTFKIIRGISSIIFL